MDPTAPLLDIRDLRTVFETERGRVTAVDGVSFTLARGEMLGIVGESGSGKSVTSLSIMRLVAEPPGRVSGEIRFEGEDLLAMGDAGIRSLRGNVLAMIYQEPMTALNPVYPVGLQIAEAVALHRGVTRAEAMARAAEMLRLVGIPGPEQRLHDYPHQLSGGMRQRVMIAMALACNPRLLIADEPTTALDVTIQAQILELMKRLRRELGMAVMLITHDLGVVAEMCERVIVMYAGRIVEEGDVLSIFTNPLHPYTEGLLASMPRLDAPRGRLHSIEGTVPDPLDLPPGCRFAPRCPHVQPRCRAGIPALETIAPGRRAACFLAAERRAP
ncbi:MAG: ABC transporter ATP-binding protein [Alphaproteobacteria bacterium]|nr:ABC transporter ATP-binding protein [Alphaproteobacteria bacterium]